MKQHLSETSNIEKFDWSNDTLTLYFRDGSVYNYLNVPMIVAAGLSTAKSAGSFLIQYVKGNYEYVKVKDANVEAEMKKLRHYKDTSVGLWATDKPELIPEALKEYFFELLYETNELLTDNPTRETV